MTRFGSFTLAASLLVISLPTSSQAPAPVHGEIIRFAADTTKSGELFAPKVGRPGSWPGLVLVHGPLGLTDAVRSDAWELAAHGYLVLAVNLYEGSTLPASEQAGEAQWSHLNHKESLTICEGAIGYLQSWSANPELIGAVGWGDGGSTVIELAKEQPHLKAAVDYGGASPVDSASLKPIASRIMIQTQPAPNIAAAIHFLDARLKGR